jgi:hypothetical protein
VPLSLAEHNTPTTGEGFLRHANSVSITFILLTHSVGFAATDWTHHGADAANSKYAPRRRWPAV